MNSASDSEQWEHEEEEQAHEIRPVSSRRLLLAGAVGSFALAASGIFLPTLEDEVHARGALGGDKGGRRGNDHKGRNKKRSHGDRKDQNNNAPRGGGPLFRSVELKVENNTSQTLQLIFLYRVKLSGDTYSQPFDDITVPDNPGDAYLHDSDRYRMSVLIRGINNGQDIHCDVRNVSFWYPRGGVSTGANLDPKNGVYGDALIPEQNFSVWEKQSSGRFSLVREPDDSHGRKRIDWNLIINP